MARYYLLLRRKGAKRWLGAIPAKASASLARLRKLVREQLKKGFVAKIVTTAQLRRLLKTSGMKAKKSSRRNTKGKTRSKTRKTKRRTVKKRTRRRKARRTRTKRRR